MLKTSLDGLAIWVLTLNEHHNSNIALKHYSRKYGTQMKTQTKTKPTQAIFHQSQLQHLQLKIISLIHLQPHL